MSDDVVSLTGDLVARESENPPGNERQVARYLTDRLRSSPVPFDIDIQEVGPGRPNVLARFGNRAKGSVLLTGHLDVVPANSEDWSSDPYNLAKRDDRVVGRGTSDMKGALAAKVLATESYFDTIDHPGEVVLAFVVDEEYGGKGTRKLLEDPPDVDAAILGEPTELQVCVAQKGVVRYEVTVYGDSGHSGRPDDAVNAIAALNRVLDRLEGLDDTLRTEPEHPLLAPETVTATEVSAGIAPNVVPDAGSVTVDWRFHPGPRTPDPFDNRLRETLANITVDGDPVSVGLDRIVFARAAEIEPEHELVRTVQEAAETAGAPASAVGFNAATDARFLIHDADIPTVLYGPGSIQHDAHTVDESVPIADLQTTVGVYREALTRLLS